MTDDSAIASTPDDTAFDWRDIHLEEDVTRSLSLGPLQIHMRRLSGEVRVATHRPGEAEDLEWVRWTPRAGFDGHLRLVPAFPDRPVIVKPEEDFWLLRDAEARIFVRLPLWVRLETTDDRHSALLHEPTAVLSDTWWGTPEEGELGYYLQTRARRRVRPEEFLEHVCICPVQLVNASDDDFLVTRFALRTRYLGVYRDGQRHWSNVTRVRYRGEAVDSALDVDQGPPPEADSPEVARPPDRVMGRGFTARTFARLRSSLGGWL